MVDHYEISLLGEDLDCVCCPADIKSLIETFQPYEDMDINEHEIKRATGLSIMDIRKARKAYHSIKRLPELVSTPIRVYWKTVELNRS